MALLLSGCSLPFIGGEEPTPTPSPDDVATVKLPIYNVSLAPGDAIPQTQIHYTGREESHYLLTIDGVEARKRVGDSLNWRGVIAPGVVAVYKLRILPTFSDSDLSALGSVEINIFNPVPEKMDDPAADATHTIYFDNVELDYTVGLSGRIPGTPFFYEGKTDDGAIFSGFEGYPYRDLGDSLSWSGRLRNNVNVKYHLRVASIKDDQVRLLGIGELWIAPVQ